MIWDDGQHYVLEHVRSHEKCYFDRNEDVLQSVQRAIKRDGSFCATDRKTFQVQPSNGHKKYYLSQLLYKNYHNKPLSWVRNGRVNFNDRNSYNLTSANLSHTHAAEADNINRRIWHMGDYIFLYHKQSGNCYFCDYEECLFRLLCHPRILWGYQPDMGRLQATVIRKKRKAVGLSFGFHSLIYAYHHYGARYSNFIGAIRKMKKHFAKHDFSVDHLDNNQLNNTNWNLSLMTRAENSAKRDMMGKVRFPFLLMAVHSDRAYKIACGRVYMPPLGFVDPKFDISFAICETPKELIEFVKVFFKHPWEDGLSPAQNLEDNPDRISLQNYYGDFGASDIRKELIEKPSDEFVAWKSDEEKELSA